MSGFDGLMEGEEMQDVVTIAERVEEWIEDTEGTIGTDAVIGTPDNLTDERETMAEFEHAVRERLGEVGEVPLYVEVAFVRCGVTPRVGRFSFGNNRDVYFDRRHVDDGFPGCPVSWARFVVTEAPQ